ncbi:MAG: biopolymer transporter ExbD [Spirochaetes bacterium]|nr:biopolymer transporter ExbD [Spirochaetota bacterium]
MKFKKKFKLNIELPASSQSDIAFLLIIFFIVTAIFFERTGIIFKLPSGTVKVSELASNDFIRIEARNEYLMVNSKRTEYNELFREIRKIKEVSGINIAILYFFKDLKFGNFIKIFQDIKKNGNIKVSIKMAGEK